jgi:transcriptional regulator with XRE-family HTH domain
MATRKQTGIGMRLQRVRELRGLRQRELSLAAGQSGNAVNRIESGDVADPGVTAISALARVLQCSVEALTENATAYEADLARFLASDLARELALTQDEIVDLTLARWYSANGAAPTLEAWASAVRALRESRRRAQAT